MIISLFICYVHYKCKSEWPKKRSETSDFPFFITGDNIQEKEDELETRNEMPCSEELGLLKHYHINLKSVPCSTTTKKRATNLLAREFKKQEFDYERQRNGYVRDFNSCCSPECDWLLDYLEIDSTVVKCLDRK